MPYQPIVATLCYVLSPDRRQVLRIHRNTRPDDQHLGKYNGLGGKLEANEDVPMTDETIIPPSLVRLRTNYRTQFARVEKDRADRAMFVVKERGGDGYQLG